MISDAPAKYKGTRVLRAGIAAPERRGIPAALLSLLRYSVIPYRERDAATSRRLVRRGHWLRRRPNGPVDDGPSNRRRLVVVVVVATSLVRMKVVAHVGGRPTVSIIIIIMIIITVIVIHFYDMN